MLNAAPAPSPVAAAPATPRTPSFPKKKFRSVLGFGSVSLDSRPRPPPASDADDDDEQPVLITTAATARQSPTDTSVFSPQSIQTPNSPPSSPRSTASSLDVEEMKIDLAAAQQQQQQHPSPQTPPPPPPRSISKPNFRLTSQWGLWTVSVAETPTDPNSYNVYVKTPTHNYTLTRSQKEITELHTKLRDSFPTAALPPFPLTNVITPPAGGKRRSSFLHTLSRLANNSSNGTKLTKGSRPNTANGVLPPSSAASPSSIYPTPLNSPPAETMSDPFAATATESLASPMSATNTTTALAGYLTSVSNDQKLRNARPWKRFMRVRTDDLESERVERAVKRVQSDVAMRASPSAHSHTVGHVNGFGTTIGNTSNSISSRLEVGTSMLSLGPNFGAGSLGLSPEGGFQSEAEGELGSASEPPSKSTSDVDVARKGAVVEESGHAKEDTQKALQPPTTAPVDVKADKRVSSIMAMPSAFSSDSALPDSVQHHTASTSHGSAPPTPTPATTELPKVASEPEEVALPPSPALGGEKKEPTREIVSGLPTPVHSPQVAATTHASRIPRSVSADPGKAGARRFKNPNLREASDSIDGDASMAEEGGVTTDADAQSTTTTDADASTNPAAKKRVKRARRPAKKVTVEDFDMLRVLGKGCAGKVLLVKYKKTGDLYALKAITKRHVLAHQELQHTLTEQAVLKRMSRENKDPFVVKLWWSFHDRDNLFLVMDFHPGGDLATQLARWGRLGRDRARFYAAEIVEGVDGLHAAGVIYRDLKPENILIGADGHIVLTDFGLSKEFPRRMNGTVISPTTVGTPTGSTSFGGDYYSSTPTSQQQQQPYWVGTNAGDIEFGATRDVTSTFCGTAEYLAPEVIQGLPYSYEVDWWSFGTMLYEMLSGITPFWANNHSDMYVRVLQDELQFPDDRAMDQDTKSLIRGLLQRNPALRISEPRIKRHPYFSMIDWDHVYYKRYIPPYIPPIDPQNASDTQNFDETFLEMQPTIENEDHMEDSEKEKTEDDGAKTDGEESIKKAGKSDVGQVEVAAPAAAVASVDVFDGYSFKGRHSVLLEDEDYEGYADEEAEDSEVLEAKKVTDALAALHVEANGSPAVVQRDDASETGTIEQAKEDQQAAVSITPSSSTVPESAVTASMSSEADSVVSPHVHKQVKEGSGFSEGASTIPSLTTGTTALTTPSGDLAESPVTAESPVVTKIVAADSAAIDDAVRSPLPLSPVIEVVDPVTGNVVDEEPVQPAIVPKASLEVAHAEVKLAPPSTPVPTRTRGSRREKSGVHALDRVRREEEDATEREEDDWDLIETPHGEDRNGAKAASLWQRGVVDRYRLAVFRKSGSSNQSSRRNVPRSVSGATFESGADPAASPSPSGNKDRRGRTRINLRKSTHNFLRAKSPSAAISAQSSAASRANLGQQSSQAALNVNSVGLLTPSPSVPVATSRPVPSLKSKSSALSKVSYGSPPSSDQSVTDLRNQPMASGAEINTPSRQPMSPRAETVKNSPRTLSAGDESEKTSNLKKMKKYTEQGAEKMLSLFGSPRHHNHQQQQQQQQ